jgi:hypothetical protein
MDNNVSLYRKSEAPKRTYRYLFVFVVGLNQHMFGCYIYLFVCYFCLFVMFVVLLVLFFFFCFLFCYNAFLFLLKNSACENVPGLIEAATVFFLTEKGKEYYLHLFGRYSWSKGSVMLTVDSHSKYILFFIFLISLFTKSGKVATRVKM